MLRCSNVVNNHTSPIDKQYGTSTDRRTTYDVAMSTQDVINRQVMYDRMPTKREDVKFFVSAIMTISIVENRQS